MTAVRSPVRVSSATGGRVWRDDASARGDGRFRALLQAAPDAMVVTRPGGQILLFNDQVARQFGYGRDELLDENVKLIIPQGFDERSLRPDGSIELVGRRKDGTEFPLELTLSRSESAGEVLLIAAIRDITVRRLTETNLAQLATAMVEKTAALEREIEERSRIFEASLDLILVVDRQGNLIRVSPSSVAILDYRPEEMIGRSAREFVYPDDLDSTRAEMRAVRRGRILRNFDSRYVHRNGHAVPLQWNGVWSEPEQRYFFIGRNMEELLETIAELKRSNEELAQFASIASHDLQEPLRMVASYTQLLSRQYKGRLDANADEFIAFAVDGAVRMQGLIQDLLAYSRIGTKEVALRDVASEKALELALVNLQSAIKNSGAQVTRDRLPVVRADESQLTQLFQNLVGNGIKYQSGGSPKIHISAAQTGEGQWQFSVRDNGIGIDPAHFEKIFGMFQRLHKREEFPGTGIGLAICKKIVDRHGGNITVESAPGMGSTFRFTLASGDSKAANER